MRENMSGITTDARPLDGELEEAIRTSGRGGSEWEDAYCCSAAETAEGMVGLVRFMRWTVNYILYECILELKLHAVLAHR